MTITTLSKLVHDLAVSKGFYEDVSDEGRFIERTCNNLHDEISELHEAWRNGKLREECDKAYAMREYNIEPLTCLEEELADIVIRVLDAAVHLGINIEHAILRKHEYNKTRSHRHGGKKS